MNVLSLFDGISCCRLALGRAGIPVDKYYASEIDKYAIAVNQYRYSDTNQLGDITKRKEWDIDFSSIDLVTGGFPCQSRSLAGKQLGDKDERGMLFWTMLDIIKEIKLKNPNIIFLLENVKMKKEFEEYITLHTEEALGNVNKHLINSSLMSAQNRRRFYWTNIEGIQQPLDRGIYLKDIIQEEVDEKYYISDIAMSKIVHTPKGLCVSYALGSREHKGGGWKHDKCPTLCARDYKDPKVVNTIRIGSIGKGGQGDRIYSVEGKSVALSANGGGRGAKTGLYKIGSVGKGQSGNVYSVDGKSTTLCANGGGMGAKTGLYSIKQRGRGYNKGGLHKEKAPTLTKNSRQENNHLALDGVRIRKLTPIECERLQNMKDNYTLVPRGKRMMSDSQRYKQCGNGRTVDVIAHILSFIK